MSEKSYVQELKEQAIEFALRSHEYEEAKERAESARLIADERGEKVNKAAAPLMRSVGRNIPRRVFQVDGGKVVIVQWWSEHGASVEVVDVI